MDKIVSSSYSVAAAEICEASRQAADPVSGFLSQIKVKARTYWCCWLIASTVGLYFALAVCRALSNSPGCDEGWFASPAFNLSTKGSFGTTVLEEANLTMTTGLHRFTYWIVPLNPLAQAAWYKLVGFGLLQMRSISIFFGLLALFALFIFFRRLTNNSNVTYLAIALIATDFVFIRSAADGRMDMMCAALNFAALGAYMHLRERNLNLAILVSHCLIVMAGLTHPNGLLGLASLLFLVLYYDIRRLRWVHLPIVSIPYIVGGISYGLYVMHDPHLFYLQLSGNGGGRLWGITAPLSALKFEIAERYLGSASGIQFMKLPVLLPYVLAIVGSLSISEIRNSKGARSLMLITAIIFTYFTFAEGTKLYLYLVHVVPIYVCLLALVARWCWMNLPRFRPFVAMAILGLLAVNLAGSFYVIYRDSYHQDYLPVVDYLNKNSNERSLIMGTSELSFHLKHKDSLLDDKFLGYNSGKVPDLIVINSRYRWEQEMVLKKQPEIYRHIERLLADDYQVTYEYGSYVVYSRR